MSENYFITKVLAEINRLLSFIIFSILFKIFLTYTDFFKVKDFFK